MADVATRTYAHRCKICGQGTDATDVYFKQNISYFFERREKTFCGCACFSCMTKMFLKFSLTTLLLTWFGIIGSCLGPCYIVGNVYEYGAAVSKLMLKAARRRMAKRPQDATRDHDQNAKTKLVSSDEEKAAHWNSYAVTMYAIGLRVTGSDGICIASIRQSEPDIDKFLDGMITWIVEADPFDAEATYDEVLKDFILDDQAKEHLRALGRDIP